MRFIFIVVIYCLFLASFGCGHQGSINKEESIDTSFSVDGKIALSSYIALSNNHLLKLKDDLSVFAKSAEARSLKWQDIQEPLAEIAQNNIAAVIWFALPDGSYWTVDSGKASGNLLDRPYWKKILNGETVLGDLVVSKSTGQNTAIIAIPLIRQDKSLAGVLGASIYLDKLSLQIKQEMGLNKNYVFYAIDSEVKGALNSNTSLIFTYPKEFGPEMSRVFDEMVSHEEGIANYHFRGSKRIVLYKKSPVIGWWYAFGVVRDN